MTEMRKRVNRATLAGVLLAALGTPGLSEPVPVGEEGELGKLLPPVAGEKVCYARSYDKAHLAAHPEQKVAAFSP
jgi:hypothetical protein